MREQIESNRFISTNDNRQAAGKHQRNVEATESGGETWERSDAGASLHLTTGASLMDASTSQSLDSCSSHRAAGAL
jgi:hypothetical protein